MGTWGVDLSASVVSVGVVCRVLAEEEHAVELDACDLGERTSSADDASLARRRSERRRGVASPPGGVLRVLGRDDASSSTSSTSAPKSSLRAGLPVPRRSASKYAGACLPLPPVARGVLARAHGSRRTPSSARMRRLAGLRTSGEHA
jgi:hypothetical protein